MQSNTGKAAAGQAVGQAARPAGGETLRSVQKLGRWSAAATGLLALAFAITFGVTTIAAPQPTWAGVAAYAAAYRPVTGLPFIPALLLAPVSVLLLASIHATAADRDRVLTLVGLAFAGGYAVIEGFNSLAQLTLVPGSIAGGELDGLAPFLMGNEHSLFWMLQALGLLFLGLGTVCAARGFRGGRLEAAINWCLEATGLFGVLGIVGLIAGSSLMLWLSSVSSALALCAAGLLLARYFARS